MQRITKLSSSQLGTFQIISVRLVDNDAVCHFHNTALDTLQFVARTGKLDKQEKSTIECTAVSLCPTPTVSTNILSNPAASQSTIVSRVLRATPPNEPAEGLGRMKDLGWTESFSIRVLSPKMLPLLRSLLGSIANTASFPSYFSNTCNPNTSIDVLLPAPGTPLIPIRMESPEYGRHFSITS